ncbi:MAG TPA: LCP family protein [Candidatus Saccharimonadales bacterium]|nr:LCP family protein [Candidatus Saccharimonadales bacterium]
MEDNKKFQRPKRPVSIDGFVSDGRGLGAVVPRSYQPSNPANSELGNYRARSDGFYPLRQAPRDVSHTPEEAEEEALLNEPILLGEELEGTKRKPHSVNKHQRAKRRLKRAGLALFSLVIIGAAYFGVKLYATEKHLFHGGGGAPALAAQVDINQLKGEGDGRVNILLLGIGGPGHDGPDLTDTMMIMSIDPINNNASLLSIPRDLWVKIPGNGYQKINAAYPDGKAESTAKTVSGQTKDGLALLDKTLEPIIGIPIHYHVIVDFSAFKQAVDALGGVTVNVPETLYDPTIAWENHWNPYIAKQGVQTMYGAQALLYARSRETSSDFARAQRQRAVIVAIKNKALSLGTFTNPVKISSLLDSFGNNVYTDFSLSNVGRLQEIFNKIPSNKITSLDLVTPPHDLLTTGSMNGLSIVKPKAGLFDYSDITSYIRNTLRDSFIAKENAQIAVYNATSISGLAADSANVLKSYGYSVTTVDNAPHTTNQELTTIVDLTHGKDKYTAHYLEERFQITTTDSMPPGTGISAPAGTNFVIILGRDAADSSQTSLAN